jgi:hypothetical protein
MTNHPCKPKTCRHRKLVVLTVERIPVSTILTPSFAPGSDVEYLSDRVVQLCVDESGFFTGGQFDVCRRFLGGESLTCAGLLDHSPSSPSIQELRKILPTT